MLNLTPYPTIKYAKELAIKIPSGLFTGNPFGNFFFPFDAEINNSKLTGICFVPNVMNQNSDSSACTTTQATDILITLVNENGERVVDSLPINALFTLNASGNIFLRRFSTKVSLADSFITLSGIQDLTSVNIFFTFYYNPNI
jgi:hypothetical protein